VISAGLVIAIFGTALFGTPALAVGLTMFVIGVVQEANK
jgi:hypothetical protein